MSEVACYQEVSNKPKSLGHFLLFLPPTAGWLDLCIATLRPAIMEQLLLGTEETDTEVSH